ncbi:MAG: AAA-like domain-containing protein [Candidatus Cloacimonetes bacterium]|nr:AAA-like domain-containing protein [Candidatus Cloacimonadota bacterium]
MKYFNITGTCIPGRHFMVDTSEKIKQIMVMIGRGNYFVINRPRQYGKTTTLALLEKELLTTEEYLPIRLSFEGIGGRMFASEECFCKEFLDLLAYEIRVKDSNISSLFSQKKNNVNDFKSLSVSISEIMISCKKNIVLMIDEVDKSSDNTIFLYFLGMLRDKYLKYQEGKDMTFHSVILAGLHDIKSLKMKIYSSFPTEYPPSNTNIVPSPNQSQSKIGTTKVGQNAISSPNVGWQGEAKFNSPWNIAVDFKVDMSFSVEEIVTMLTDYTNSKSADWKVSFTMDIKSVSERVYFWTNGYPFLVSKLCKMVDEEILPKRENKNWDPTDIDNVANALCKETNTLFEDFAKNLQNKPEVSDLIEHVILGRNDVPFDLLNPIINFAYMYGMIRKNEYEKVSIHNKIFEERMTSYYITKYALQYKSVHSKIQEPYIKKNGRLDIEMILLKFQEAVREKYSNDDIWKSDEFLEKDLRMLFLMFLKPIINGLGFSFKEVQTGAEKRLDVVVVFKDEKFVVELKIWRGAEYHKKGLKQLKAYMKAESVNKGYMLIMSKNKEKEFVSAKENGVFCVYV